MAEQFHCPDCGWRAMYDRKPKSLLGRLWRWHINFCPGWKAYFLSLPAEEKAKLAEDYRFTKYMEPSQSGESR